MDEAAKKLAALGRNGWRWEISFDPAAPVAERYYCALSRGAGPPPYGQYVSDKGRTQQTAIARTLRQYVALGLDKRAIPAKMRRNEVADAAARAMWNALGDHGGSTRDE